MARESFDHRAIEKAAQEKWEALDLYRVDLTDETKEKYYLLFEFPYPSGDLHIGHWYAFALTDIYARKLRMSGKNVLFPMGFDAFGLPAENAAIKRGVDPKEWTYQNMETMRTQMKTMGASMDWSKEVITCEPSYYQWTQWLFSKLFEHGLAERKMAPVKWCPKDQTVLANEQVVDGHCERCGSPVEDKSLTQWFFKITSYAERLLTDLDPLPWREEIKEAQRAWIGESEGARITFAVSAGGETIDVPVFTTRPDTIFGATYLVLAPEHAVLARFLEHTTNGEEVRAYQRATGTKTERERSENKEKTGVMLLGITATNPATGEAIPVYVADYVLSTYGTGAVMAVPAHDERDYAFAQKYHLPVVQVVEGEAELSTGDGPLTASGLFTGRNNREALWDIADSVGGERVKNYRLRDWLVSRQRYWGCPIPVVYDPEGVAHAVPAEHLPWLLPTDVDLTPGAAGAGKSPLATSKELHERVEKLFGAGWTPEYDTLDVFVDSSWYFMRYLAHTDEHAFTDQAVAAQWMPVDRYSGGSEHTTMHLLYARFFTKALHDLALSPVSEPFNERFNRGIILGPDGQKMSKSKGNVINPDEVVAKFGSDAVRMYLAFLGPYNEPGHYPWNLDGAQAMRKFLDRVHAYQPGAPAGGKSTKATEKGIDYWGMRITRDTDAFKFNTAIAFLMQLLTELEDNTTTPETYQTFIQLLAPFAPHLAEHLWARAGGEGSVHHTQLPNFKKASVQAFTLTIQVNGKKRATLILPTATDEAGALAAARAEPKVVQALAGATPKKVIYIQGRTLNIVV